MKNRLYILNPILVMLAMILSSALSSCTENKAATLQDQLTPEDSAAIRALVLYPDTFRTSIFEAAKYPKTIHQVAELQEKTSAAFAELIKDYPQEEQEEIWDMTRYPGLIGKLSGEQKTNEEIENILEAYPEDVHETASKYATSHQPLLNDVHELELKSEQEFNDLIDKHPSETQQAFRELVEVPEALSILDEHEDMTKLVGDLYTRDPERVMKTADSLSVVVSKENTEDVAAWKQELEEDPAAKQEFEDAAETYAAEIGYEEAEYTTAPSYYYVHDYSWYPYDYWFGYPTWYPYGYWYPYPYWYDWGYYYDGYGNAVVIGLPSSYFTYWYFYYPDHIHHHPHLCNAYVSYYYGPRKVRFDNNAVIVRNWVEENRKYLPPDFTTNEKGRVEAIKEFGRFEQDWERLQAENKTNGMSRDDFFASQKDKYPGLHAEGTRKDQDVNTGKIQKKDPGLIQNPTGKKDPPSKQPPVKMNKNPEGKEIEQSKNAGSRYDYNKVHPAQQYHKNVWDQNQPSKRQMPDRNMPGQPNKKQKGGGR